MLVASPRRSSNVRTMPGPDPKSLYEVALGVGPRAETLLTTGDADEALEWARVHFRRTGDTRLVVKADEYDERSGLFRPKVLWRARLGDQQFSAIGEHGVFSSLTGRRLAGGRGTRGR